MHEHEYYSQLCSAALDNELTAAERAELDAHLAACPECAVYMEQLWQMHKLLSGTDLETPPSLHEDVMDLVLAEAQRTARPGVTRRVMPVFTMLAAAAAVVIMVMTGAVGDLFGSGMANNTIVADSAPAPASEEPASGGAPTAYHVAPAELAPAESSDTADSGTAAGAATYSTPADQEPVTEKKSRSLIDAATPGGETVALDEVPAVLQELVFVGCYVAVGTGEIPEFGGTLVAESEDGTTYYFTVKNNMSVLEKSLGALTDAEYEPASRHDIKGLFVDEKAENVLIIIIRK